jgi:hypothetical protein
VAHALQNSNAVTLFQATFEGSGGFHKNALPRNEQELK